MSLDQDNLTDFQKKRIEKQINQSLKEAKEASVTSEIADELIKESVTELVKAQHSKSKEDQMEALQAADEKLYDASCHSESASEYAATASRGVSAAKMEIKGSPDKIPPFLSFGTKHLFYRVGKTFSNPRDAKEGIKTMALVDPSKTKVYKIEEGPYKGRYQVYYRQ